MFDDEHLIRLFDTHEPEYLMIYRVEGDLPLRASYKLCDRGDMVAWPQNSTHRVENIEGLNVSLSTEHFTPQAIRKQNTYLANYYLRRCCGCRPTRRACGDGSRP